MKVRIKRSAQPKFNPLMLVLARESRGFTQAELAEKLGVAQSILSRIEKGLIPLSENLKSKLPEILEYSSGFFDKEDEISDFSLYHYRRRIKLAKKELEKSEAQMNITLINIETLLNDVELPRPNYPTFNVTTKNPADKCAQALREFWGVPKGRIVNLTTLLEENGIMVVNMDFDSGEIDGIGVITKGGNPVIFMDSSIPADRYRLTLAHELGHLLLHVGKQIPETRDVEKEAFLFAAEFMMPEKEIKSQLEDLNLEKLGQLKMFWKISMGALIKRAQTAGVVNESQYYHLWKLMGKEGYKKREPEALDFPKERPTLLTEMIDAFLIELGYTHETLAAELDLTVEEFRRKYLSSDENTWLKVSKRHSGDKK
jgi:Zn-dependent peptidase ImmA (M78 family)/DNA-binding XRE family transcriptional regulator